MKAKYENAGIRIERQKQYDQMVKEKSSTADRDFRRRPYTCGRKEGQ